MYIVKKFFKEMKGLMAILLVVNWLKFNVFHDGKIDKLKNFAYPGKTHPRMRNAVGWIICRLGVST